MKLKVNPLKPYLPIYKTKARYIHLYGGRSSGKSFAIAEYMVVKSFQVGFKGLILRQVLSTTDESIKAQVEAAIEQMGLSQLFETTAKEIRNKQSGNVISVMGFKTSNSAYSAKMKSLVDYTHVVVEEAIEVPQEDFDKMDESIRKADVELKIVLVYNTPHIRHPLAQRWFKKDGTPLNSDDTLYIHTTYKDVPAEYINESTLDLIEKTKRNNYEKYKHVWLGEFILESEKQIYSGWKSIEKFPEDLPFVYGLDLGFRDEWGLVKVATKGDNVYAQELLYKSNLLNSEVIQIIQNLPPALIIADSAEPRTIQEFRRAGLRVIPAFKGKDSVKSGINQIRDLQVFVLDGSDNLWNEYDKYEWADKVAEVPVDKLNHLLDPLRYAVNYLKRASRPGKYSVAVG